MIHVEVVLPTYNGLAYLEQQLDSIDQQTLRPDRVLLRDDGSTDGTQSLLNRLQARYGSWLQVLPGDGNLGCSANVNRLLEITEAPYVALADQDDIWLPHRLAASMSALKQLELQFGPSRPLLVHSDLQLVAADGQSLGCTYLQRQRLDPRRTSLFDLALTNVVTGCTVLINRALLQKALPIPQEALMHDWWLALVASETGVIGLIPKPTVDYRQHALNVLGARGTGLWVLTQKFFRRRSQQPPVCLPELMRQLNHLQQRYGLPSHPLQSLLAQPRWRRFWSWLLSNPMRPGLTKHGPLRTLGLWLVLLLTPVPRFRF